MLQLLTNMFEVHINYRKKIYYKEKKEEKNNKHLHKLKWTWNLSKCTAPPSGKFYKHNASRDEYKDIPHDFNQTKILL